MQCFAFQPRYPTLWKALKNVNEIISSTATMWVNYSYIKGTFIWFIYQNGTDSKIKSYWDCFGRTQLWDMRRMEEKSNSTGNTSLTYYSQILEPQMELVEESITVTMLRETVGMKGGRNIWTAFLGKHFYFFPLLLCCSLIISSKMFNDGYFKPNSAHGNLECFGDNMWS